MQKLTGLNGTVLGFAVEMQKRLDTGNLELTLRKATVIALAARLKNQTQLLVNRLSAYGESGLTERFNFDTEVASIACTLMELARREGFTGELEERHK